VVLSHLRFAAGVCVLATGLVLGGAAGAIAVAEPDPGGSTTHGTDGATGSSQGSSSSPAGSTASNPVGSIADTARKTLQGVTSAVGSGPKPTAQPSTGAKSPQTVPAGTNSTDQKKDAGPVVAAPNAVASGADVNASVPNTAAPVPGAGAPAMNTPAAVADSVAPVTKTPAPVPGAAAPLTNTPAPVPGAAALVTNTPAPVPDTVAPVTNTAASVPGAAALVANTPAPVPDAAALVANTMTQAPDAAALVTNTVAQVPGAAALGFDVIATVQNMVTSVAGGLVGQLQSDVSSFFGAGGAQPAVNRFRGVEGAVLATAAGDSVSAASSMAPLPTSPAGIPGVPVADDAAPIATLGGIAMTDVGWGSSVTGTAALAPRGTSLMDVRLHFGQAFGGVLRSASVAELAAVALPGVCGLLIFTAAGVGIGHRQAKAGVALQTSSIARFAPRGPFGVVRSGSLVVIRRATAGTQRLLDQAA
jgi:hypothetical protein